MEKSGFREKVTKMIKSKFTRQSNVISFIMARRRLDIWRRFFSIKRLPIVVDAVVYKREATATLGDRIFATVIQCHLCFVVVDDWVATSSRDGEFSEKLVKFVSTIY